jgi:AraC-like DNA-binding protein
MLEAHFKPGGTTPFVGMSGAEFQDQVVECEAVWGSSARELRERLLAAPGSNAKFHHLEQFLTECLNRFRTDQKRQERIAWATRQFCQQPHVAAIGVIAGQLNISHKHFIEQFREQVGLTRIAVS